MAIGDSDTRRKNPLEAYSELRKSKTYMSYEESQERFAEITLIFMTTRARKRLKRGPSADPGPRHQEY